jgi:hypothetical protein
MAAAGTAVYTGYTPGLKNANLKKMSAHVYFISLRRLRRVTSLAG